MELIPGESLLAHLFVLRFPILTVLILLVLPVVALRLAKPLLANLFDLTAVQAIWVTIAACVMSWTALFSGWVVISYGPVRFGIAHLPFVWEAQVPPWSVVWTMTLVPLPLLISAWFYSVKHQATTSGRFLVGLLTGYVLSSLLVVADRSFLKYFVNFPELFSARRPEHTAGFLRGYLDMHGRLLPGLRVVITAFVLSLLVYLILGFAKYLRWKIFREVPSLAYVLCLLTLACWTLTGLSFFLDAYRVPVVLVIVVYLMVTAQFSSSDHYYHVFAERSGGPIATPAQALAASHLDSVVLVAANGGGIQSAAWTAKVLSELDREWRRFSPENETLFARSVRAISSVSGGSVGAMFFTAAYSDNGLPENGSKLTDVVQNATTSSLDDVAWGLVYPDLWRTLTPFLWKKFVDRGNALEKAFQRLVPETAEGLSSWRSSVANGHRPANLFNATLTETGGRLLISTSEFATPHEACSQFNTMYKNQDLAIASAARLSATFPFITPATRADLGGPATPQFHVVDGGYYDNYGMATLAEWLREGLSIGETHIRQVLVLQIRGFPPDAPEKPDSIRGWFYQLYAPIGTMLHARSCGQLAHNDIEFDLMQQVCADHDLRLETAIFQFKAKEMMDNPPLSWHLTNRQKNAIDKGWDNEDVKKAMEQVQEFLQKAKPVKNQRSPLPSQTLAV